MNKFTYEKTHFLSDMSSDKRRELFKKSVNNVNVEIFSYCNRQCTYCPVSQVESRRDNRVLPLDKFEKIINNLSSIEYDEGLCFNLYNEPTAEREILLERIRYARKHLPKAKIYFSSNGDYLTSEYIKELSVAGLSELYITLHIEKGKQYQDAVQMGRFCDMSVRLNKAIKIESITQGQAIQGRVKIHGISISIFSVNYYKFGVNRGGLVDAVSVDKKRQAPCERPFTDFTVSYDGTLFPCCQLFVDDVNHKEKYSIGNLSEFDTIFDAYAADLMARWRREVFLVGPKLAPCDVCLEAEREVSCEEAEFRNEKLNEFLKNKPTNIYVKKKSFVSWMRLNK